MTIHKVGQLPDPPKRNMKSRSEGWYQEMSAEENVGEWYLIHVQEEGQSESSARSKKNSLRAWADARGVPLKLAERKIDGKKHFYAMVPESTG